MARFRRIHASPALTAGRSGPGMGHGKPEVS
ncbi:protein of unknown function [Methylorubrum extorquens]|uniref:Uncharacterized protein n=1 Tax=Methylorubrum extorquens TaxID=408 RepID=A0A2N9APE7_METEX|nr:protein of unknown function [Methylorubrum extorquens]